MAISNTWRETTLINFQFVVVHPNFVNSSSRVRKCRLKPPINSKLAHCRSSSAVCDSGFFLYRCAFSTPIIAFLLKLSRFTNKKKYHLSRTISFYRLINFIFYFQLFFFDSKSRIREQKLNR